MAEKVTLTRAVYKDSVNIIEEFAKEQDTSYLDLFEVEFPDGLNTADSLEICRIVQSSGMESRDRLMRLCIAGKNVKVKCPNGESYTFCLGHVDDALGGLELFQKEPLARMAIADIVYGYVLKKSIRLPKPGKQPEAATSSK